MSTNRDQYQRRVWMFSRFIPQPSLKSMGAKSPRRSDVTKELTREMRSVSSYSAGWFFAKRAI